MNAPESEYDGRVAALRTRMDDASIDLMIVTDPLSYGYFSGHRAPNHAGRPSILLVPGAGDCCLITMGAQQFFAELDAAPLDTWVADQRFYPEFPYRHDTPVDWLIGDYLRQNNLTHARVGLELGAWTRLGIPVEDYLHIVQSFPAAEFVDGGSLVWACRRRKSPWEIERLRHACRELGSAWEQVLAWLDVGVSQQEVREAVAAAYRERGCESGFLGFARGATGAGGTFQDRDVLYLDGGGLLGGYATDFTRRAVFGAPTPRQLREHRAGLDAQRAMLDEVRPGVSVDRLFDVGNTALRELGYESVNYSADPARRTGHGIGLEQGEPPSINAYDDTVLEEGMVLTIEPKFMSEDGLVNPDDMVVVTADGFDLLSCVPHRELHVAAA